ncbi:MAG TPA: sensor domain-containing diguanylate cyclase [Vicinamibacterales bacterium]
MGFVEYSGLALVAVLLFLTAAFFHQHGKRREARARIAAAEDDAVQAQARAVELERLVAFGQALGRSLDADTIRDVVVRHLPKLAGTDDVWVMTLMDGRWHTLMGAARGTPVDPISVEGFLCVPLTAGGSSVGVLGIPESCGPFDDARQGMLSAAAALLGIAVRNAQLFSEVRETSLRDGLTGCFNRTHALEVIDTELRRARRSQMPVSLIMLDLDHFKGINDRHGHLCGDAVLAAVGARMREVLRGSDLKCRYGGEEFLVLLPETSLDGARRVADTLRRQLADMAVQWKNETLHVTASLGVTMAQPSEIDTQALIARADAALYRAKDQGRNCVRLSLEMAVV